MERGERRELCASLVAVGGCRWLSEAAGGRRGPSRAVAVAVEAVKWAQRGPRRAQINLQSVCAQLMIMNLIDSPGECRSSLPVRNCAHFAGNSGQPTSAPDRQNCLSGRADQANLLGKLAARFVWRPRRGGPHRKAKLQMPGKKIDQIRCVEFISLGRTFCKN